MLFFFSLIVSEEWRASPGMNVDLKKRVIRKHITKRRSGGNDNMSKLGDRRAYAKKSAVKKRAVTAIDDL